MNSRRAAASVAQHRAGLVLVAIMVDRTTYPDDQVPELALRQVFGRQRLPENLCLLAAEVGLRTMDTFAMLGDNITGVKQTLNRIVPDPARFGADAAARGVGTHQFDSSMEDMLDFTRAFRLSAC